MLAVACLRRTVSHPQTHENLTLPRRIDGAQVSVKGDCRGQEVAMLVALCTYNRNLRLSTWSITYTNCSVNCLAQSITHSVSGESFHLFNAADGQMQTFSGMCGRHKQEMFSAVCTTTGWDVTELECVLMCPPHQISHSQQPALLPAVEVPVNSTLRVDMPCDSTNITIITARCVLNTERSDGIWTDIVKETCEVQCKPEQVIHPNGTNWSLDRSSLGNTSTLRGLCDNRTIDLASVSCEGDITNGAFWNVSFLPCHVQCPLQTFVHPHTKKLIQLRRGEINETVIQNLKCNGEDLPVEIKCEGSSSVGAKWRLKSIPKCTPSCPSTEWFDPVTSKTYIVNTADFLSEVKVKGFCGGNEKVLMLAKCQGDIADGVSWQYENFNCTPTCDSMTITHPDTQANFSLPISAHGKAVRLTGLCNGIENSPLISATCGGSIASVPEWVNITYETCIGYCDSKNVSFNDVERESYMLQSGRVGDRLAVNGTCALLSFIEITAECIGSAADGGYWNYAVHP